MRMDRRTGADWQPMRIDYRIGRGTRPGAGDLPTSMSRRALRRPTRAHQPMFDGSVSVVLAGVSPTE